MGLFWKKYAYFKSTTIPLPSFPTHFQKSPGFCWTKLCNISYSPPWKNIQYGVASVSRIDKIQVSFAKEPYKRDHVLQKRQVILSIRLTVAPHVALPGELGQHDTGYLRVTHTPTRTHAHTCSHTHAHTHTRTHTSGMIPVSRID